MALICIYWTQLRRRHAKVMNQEQEKKAPVDEPHYRVATVDDAVMLRRLVEDSFQDPGTSFGDPSGAMAQFSIPLDRMTDKITRPGSAVIIATEPANGGSVVGCFQIFQKSASCARLTTLAVDAQYQGRGIARSMLRHAEERCRRDHLGTTTTMQLNTLSSRDGLRDWYRRCGYKETGAREPFVGGARDDGGADGLYFVVMEKKLEAADDDDGVMGQSGR